MIVIIDILSGLFKVLKKVNYLKEYEREIKYLTFQYKCISWSELIDVNTGKNYATVVLPLFIYASNSLVDDIYHNEITPYNTPDEAIHNAAMILVKPFQGFFNIRARWFFFSGSLGNNIGCLIWKLPFMKNREWKADGKIVNRHTVKLRNKLLQKVKKSL